MRVLLLASSLLCACASAPRGLAAPSGSAAPRRPNILFVMIDDLGWMDLHAQGNDRFRTPNIDRLAAEGTRFTDFYAAAPVCSPTRAACVTGLAPARLKVTNHIPDRWSFYDRKPSGDGPRRGREWGPGRSRNTLDKAAPTIAQRLKQAGYRTGFVGKWHLAGPDWRTEDASMFPEAYGFDVNVAGNAMGGPGTFFAPINMPNYQAGEAGDYLPDCSRRRPSTSSLRRDRKANRSSCACGPTPCTTRSRRRRSSWRATPTRRSPTCRRATARWSRAWTARSAACSPSSSGRGSRTRRWSCSPRTTARCRARPSPTRCARCEGYLCTRAASACR